MDINSLTYGQLKEIAALFGAGQSADAFTPHIGKLCIIRTYASGVFFGRVTKQDGRMVEIAECRRLWSWKASEGISLSAVAVNGIDASASRVTEAVSTQTVLDAIEIIPASSKCINSLVDAKAARAS